jgi:hypothetical protein
MSLTRRGLLRRGGASAAGAAVAGSLGVPVRAAAKPGDDRARNALVLVLPLIRKSHVGAFPGGGSAADTPNLDALTGQSLRFDRAIPESMPALPARRALLTGVRCYPFRDWRRTAGMPPVPGFNPIWDHQPVLTETAREHGVRTVWISDNPVLRTRRFPELRAPARRAPLRLTVPGIEGDVLPSLDRASRATAAHFRAGIAALRELRGGRRRFLLGVDPFSPEDATAAPRVYVRPGEVDDEGIGPMDGRLVRLGFSSDDVDRVRERYVSHVETVDRWVGRLMDALHDRGLADETAVVALGDHGISLGEHGYLGRAAPTSHRRSYEVPLVIRHPGRERAGDDVDWYASTQDVAPTVLAFLGLRVPGKMLGEDLTALFDGVDQWDLFNRPRSITAVGSMIVVRDRRWLMVVDRQELERRLYDDDEEADDDIKRYDDVANKEPGVLTDLSATAIAVAGGNLPEFGPDGALRPGRERGDDDVDDDGIPNDFDPVDNDEKLDGVSAAELRFDGRYP